LKLTSQAITCLKNRKISFLLFSIQNPIIVNTEEPFQGPSELTQQGSQMEIETTTEHPKSIFERIKPLPKVPNFSEISKKNFEALENAPHLFPASYSKLHDEDLDFLAINGIDFMRNLLFSFDYRYNKLKEYLQLNSQILLLFLIQLNKPFNNQDFFAANLESFFQIKNIEPERNRKSLFWIGSDLINLTQKFEKSPDSMLQEEIQNIKENVSSYLSEIKAIFNFKNEKDLETIETKIMNYFETIKQVEDRNVLNSELKVVLQYIQNFIEITLKKFSVNKISEFISNMMNDEILKKIQWQNIERDLKRLKNLEKQWKSKEKNPTINLNFNYFLSLTNICSGDIFFDVKGPANVKIHISFPLYHENQMIFSCNEFSPSTWNHTYHDYLDEINEHQLKLQNLIKHKNEDYLHSERALLMFCYEYAGEIATKFLEMCKNFEKIENITIKIYSERCSCEHCSILYLNSNSNIYSLITRLIHILHERDICSKKSLQNSNEYIQKITTFSGENKFNRFESNEDQNENFLIDLENIRNYHNLIFFSKSIQIDPSQNKKARSYFISTISRKDDNEIHGGEYYRDFLPKLIGFK